MPRITKKIATTNINYELRTNEEKEETSDENDDNEEDEDILAECLGKTNVIVKRNQNNEHYFTAKVFNNHNRWLKQWVKKETSSSASSLASALIKIKHLLAPFSNMESQSRENISSNSSNRNRSSPAQSLSQKQ